MIDRPILADRVHHLYNQEARPSLKQLEDALDACQTLGWTDRAHDFQHRIDRERLALSKQVNTVYYCFLHPVEHVVIRDLEYYCPLCDRKPEVMIQHKLVVRPLKIWTVTLTGLNEKTNEEEIREMVVSAPSRSLAKSIAQHAQETTFLTNNMVARTNKQGASL